MGTFIARARLRKRTLYNKEYPTRVREVPNKHMREREGGGETAIDGIFILKHH